MDVTLAWTGWMLAMAGLGLGLLGAMVPGFPGAAVALLGLTAYAVVTGFSIVPPEALLFGCVLTLFAGAAQALSPIWGLRLVSRAAGAGTGASVGVVAGMIAPMPVLAIALGTLGAVGGAIVGPGRWLSRLAALVGLVPALAVAVAVDLVAVCGIGAVLAVAQYLAG